jgi:hypothetical protein
MGQKGKNRSLEPKNGIWGPKSVWSVIYPSIWNFTWSKKKHTFAGQKGKNKPSEPKNGTWAPKIQKYMFALKR